MFVKCTDGQALKKRIDESMHFDLGCFSVNYLVGNKDNQQNVCFFFFTVPDLIILNS